MSRDHKQPERKLPEENTKISWTDTIAIVILAGGLFNLPSILKKPTKDAEWMMLVIVIAMIVLGAILLGLPRVIRRKKE